MADIDIGNAVAAGAGAPDLSARTGFLDSLFAHDQLITGGHDLSKLQRFNTDSPQDRTAVGDRLLQAGRFSEYHHFVNGTPTPDHLQVAQASTPSTTSGAGSTNAAAPTPPSSDPVVDRLQKQQGDLSQLQQQLADKKAHEITWRAQPQADKLQHAVDGQMIKVNSELSLRATAAGTGLGAVKAQQTLAQSKTLASDHPLDTKALSAKIDGLSTYDKPFWTSSSIGGPMMPERKPTDPKYALGGSTALATAVKNGTLTQSEADVASTMSPSEGHFDSVQAYDNQTVTLGAMQKTVTGAGGGELPQQVHAFQQNHPADYQRLFADKGWTVQTGGTAKHPTYSMTYKNPSDPKAPTLTGSALYAYIKTNDASHWQVLKPLQDAGRDPTFQGQQVADFKARLEGAVNTTPDGYSSPVKAYVSSEQAAALVLDQSVNRPGRVADTFGGAMDSFYVANPKASQDPSTWTPEQRTSYEPQILKAYVDARNTDHSPSRMTDSAARAQRIISSNLSPNPLSFTTP